MYEPFPGNYVWNLSTNLALMCGGNIGEIDAACRPIREAAARGEDAGTARFFDSWLAVADQVERNAEADEAAGRLLSAAEKYGRASTYYLTAERMQARDYAPRKIAYAKGLALFAKRVRLARENCEFVEIAYEGASFTGLFIKAPPDANGRPAPCLVSCNGLDSMKEQIYHAGNPAAFLKRGVSTLLIDQPGTGEALRLRGLHGVHDSERWASAALDYLLTRDDVDPARIGIFGLSLGGYYAPRAAAMEPRFALCAVMGANHDWGEMQKRRRQREGENPVPHYWDHVMWVFGKPDIDSFMAWAPSMCLDGVVERIRVPFLVTHGEGDRQIPLEYAHLSFDQAVNSPKRHLHVFRATDYEVEHCGADNGTISRDYIADWVAETFGCAVR
ncbi:alpha/beta hydrolase family protein [Nitrospirillum sp. BR 11163]|uniref:alpha/beta hydrolase family protein n=1 Tax=Nitrospirillum sp. BR 11163 TaxID=3104323 RepID=UPI002AFE3842|nr:prolyl oligopeptidase family serine peptidase [Nitrospirillum sp. BR 11163]MEA1672637.1 prolyl oligopeptidase family serine peptidase [Nitrospirillum sp. BR 11163]